MKPQTNQSQKMRFFSFVIITILVILVSLNTVCKIIHAGGAGKIGNVPVCRQTGLPAGQAGAAVALTFPSPITPSVKPAFKVPVF